VKKASEILPSLKIHDVVEYEGCSKSGYYYCRGCHTYLGLKSSLSAKKAEHAAAMVARAREADAQPLLDVALRELRENTEEEPETVALLEILADEVRELRRRLDAMTADVKISTVLTEDERPASSLGPPRGGAGEGRPPGEEE
jgi:hypothetical protein